MPTSLKTLDPTTGRVGGYLIAWGNPHQRDLQGEYFTPQTDLGLEWYAQRPVLYHHGLDGALKAAVIGVIDHLHTDEQGVWAEAQLDLRQQYARTIQQLIDRGTLGWSSGSLPHLVQVADDGRIERWPIVEGSLTPTPAEPRRTEVRTIKSAYAALGLDTSRLQLSADSHQLSANQSPSVGAHGCAPASQWDGCAPAISNPSVGTPFLASAAYSSNPLPNQPYAESCSLNVDSYKGVPMSNIIELDPTTAAEPTPRKRLPLGDPQDALKTRLSVASPYDTLDALDMLHGYVLLRAAKSFRGVSETYSNALAHKVSKAGITGLKADELTYSTQSGFGDEWVPDLWSAQIWNRARLENAILPLFRSVEMPSNPFELPIEGTDPSVFFVPETKNETDLTLAGSANPIPDSKVGSGKIQLTAQKLALRVGFSAELVEDSIVPVLNIYREQAMRAILASIDHVLLNGDTATSGNINKDGGTPTGTDRYLAFNGLRKLPLVTNTANAVDAAGVPTLALLRQARFTMSPAYAARPTDLAWIVDTGSYAKLLGLSEFLTMEKAGPLATAQTGQIGYMDGAPVIVSAEMSLAAANGKVSTTGASNVKGTALCVYRPGWFVGYRRRIAVSVDYLPYYDSYQLTATVRLAFAPFDTEAASALYNVTV
ncbi:MAG TPA: phage major capsid protein [Aggregatilineales bacterium]|nr:phage major capsid protein [Aggregatilineales bacterium]